MNFKIVFYLMAILGAISFTSCEQSEGEGGSSVIRGRVMVLEYDKEFIKLKDTIPLQNEDVFIIYGDNDIYGDRFRTDYNGYYEFNYLQKGSYRIFVYSKDPTKDYELTNELIPKFQDVEITEDKQTVLVEDIYIYN